MAFQAASIFYKSHIGGTLLPTQDYLRQPYRKIGYRAVSFEAHFALFGGQAILQVGFWGLRSDLC